MKNLEMNQMEEIQGGGCGWQGWAGFGVLVVVGVVAGAAIISTGGTAAVLMGTMAGKVTAGALTVAGISNIADYCD